MLLGALSSVGEQPGKCRVSIPQQVRSTWLVSGLRKGYLIGDFGLAFLSFEKWHSIEYIIIRIRVILVNEDLGLWSIFFIEIMVETGD